MKLNQLASAAMVFALGLWASNARARIILNEFEKLNFSLVATQQGLDNSQTSSNVLVSTIKTSRITSKDLLNFLAKGFNTNWPAGAQLALENVSQEIFVVDKTGTNPVFDCSAGINAGGTNVVYFRFMNDTTVFRGKTVITATNVLQTQAHFGMVFFNLFSEQDGITNTDLYFEGLDAATVNSHAVNTTETITWRDTVPVAGDGTLGNATWTVVKGRVTGSGKWKGFVIII